MFTVNHKFCRQKAATVNQGEIKLVGPFAEKIKGQLFQVKSVLL